MSPRRKSNIFLVKAKYDSGECGVYSYTNAMEEYARIGIGKASSRSGAGGCLRISFSYDDTFGRNVERGRRNF